MSLGVFPPLQFFWKHLRRIGINSFFKYLVNSLVKPSGPEFFCVGKFLYYWFNIFTSNWLYRFSISQCISFLIKYFIVLLRLSQLFFTTFPTSTYCNPAPIVSTCTVVHVCGPFVHVLWLFASPPFYHYPPLPSILVTITMFHVSTPVVLFC